MISFLLTPDCLPPSKYFSYIISVDHSRIIFCLYQAIVSHLLTVSAADFKEEDIVKLRDKESQVRII